MIGAAANSFRVPQQQVAQSTVVPAPIKGMDARVNASIDNPEVCIWAINMVPSDFGMRVRSGYREWQIGLGSEVRTIVPYKGLAQLGTADRIFAMTEDGIYDVTVAGAAPVNKLMFGTTSEDSGFGIYIHYVTEAGADLIFYADGENGLFTYTPSTDTWAQTTGITSIATASAPLVITDVVFVVQHKLRIWLIEKGSSKAWYLPIRAIAGEATEFFYAQKFKNGGDLVGLYNWTVDGGNGRDDHLVAVSRAGDVIPYTGEDPADDMTWTSTGTFFIGAIPRGNRVASEHGGELYMLSTLGVITMSDLLQGANPADPFRNLIGYRVGRLLREDMDVYQNQHGWTMRFDTGLGALIITTPERNDLTYRQYVYNLSTGGWGLWRAVPMLASDVWEGKIMFGDKSGRMLRMDVAPDNVTLDGLNQTKIDFFLLSSYQTMGAPGVNKQVLQIRPNFITDKKPAFEVFAFYDYLISEPLPPTAEPGTGSGSAWDSALWDVGVWTISTQLPFFRALGAAGMGRSVAVAMTGSTYTDTFMASWDVLWHNAGFL
jgi:hypothetical protein